MTHHDSSDRAKRQAARAEHLAHSAIDDARMRLKRLREEARLRGEAFVDEVKDRGNDLLKEAQGRSRRAVRGAGYWIGENPLQAVSIAFIAGAVIGGLLSRRED